MVKVADFGTSRFLEIAAHGTTVIGSPPYMAPEQFQGKAVFASDIYSLGVTMYQMLTGSLPYNTPAPGDLERLDERRADARRRGRGTRRFRKAISDIVMKAMAPDIAPRYQRAADLLDAVLGRPRRDAGAAERRTADAVAAAAPDSRSAARGRQPASRRTSAATLPTFRRHLPRSTRTTPQARFCWQCRRAAARRAMRQRVERVRFCARSRAIAVCVICAIGRMYSNSA